MTEQNKNNLIKWYHGTIDDTKPKVLVLTGSDVFANNMNLDCWYRFVAEYWILRGYQLVFLGKEQSQSRKEIVSLGLDAGGFRDKSYRSKDIDDYRTENYKFVRDTIQHELIDLCGQIDRIQTVNGRGHFILPLQSHVPPTVNRELSQRQNEFHDCVESPETFQYSEKITDEFYNKVSPTAFSTVHCFLYFSIVDYVMESFQGCIIDKFIIDPSIFYPFFQIKWPGRVNLWYFGDDRRGQREFRYFPLGELLHCSFEQTMNPLESFMSEEKNRTFFFAGSIIYDKGERPEKYWQYLHDLRIENSDLFIPLRKNGVNQSYRENSSQTSKAKDGHLDLFDSIKSHPLWKPALLPDELKTVEPRYKYSLILKCVSQTDSLNFRPVNYAKDRVLPLLDPEYDPECLQIPRELQNKLVVQDSNGIQERVEWFEENPDEREEIIDQLRDLFNVDWWLSADQDQINRELDVYFS